MNLSGRLARLEEKLAPKEPEGSEISVAIISGRPICWPEERGLLTVELEQGPEAVPEGQRRIAFTPPGPPGPQWPVVLEWGDDHRAEVSSTAEIEALLTGYVGEVEWCEAEAIRVKAGGHKVRQRRVFTIDMAEAGPRGRG